MNRKDKLRLAMEQWVKETTIEEFIEDHKRFNLVGNQKNVDSPLVSLISDEEYQSLMKDENHDH